MLKHLVTMSTVYNKQSLLHYFTRCMWDTVYLRRGFDTNVKDGFNVMHDNLAGIANKRAYLSTVNLKEPKQFYVKSARKTLVAEFSSSVTFFVSVPFKHSGKSVAQVLCCSHFVHFMHPVQCTMNNKSPPGAIHSIHCNMKWNSNF